MSILELFSTKQILYDFMTMGKGTGSMIIEVDAKFAAEKMIMSDQIGLMASRCDPRRAPIIDMRQTTTLDETELGYVLWWLNLGCRLNTFEAIQEGDDVAPLCRPVQVISLEQTDHLL